MAKLVTVSCFPNPDEAYVSLVDAHRGLSAEASTALNARLVLILANHIGDLTVLREAIALAKQAGPSAASTVHAAIPKSHQD